MGSRWGTLLLSTLGEGTPEPALVARGQVSSRGQEAVSVSLL